MSRGTSTRLVATLPASYGNDFEKKLDKRTRGYRAFKAKVTAILADQGGDPTTLSHFEQFAIKKAAFDEVVIEAGMAAFFTSGTIDYGVHSQASFSWAGTVNKSLGGPQRKAKPVRSLRDVMAGAA